MSQLITKLKEAGRDGIQWPSPVGTWKQNEGINRLETFANNLDVSQTPQDTDLLNSVPTPWARLLLFESALYKPNHPSHGDVEDQWRGLLGVIALANSLNLELTTKVVSLSSFSRSGIAKSFIDLRPRYVVADSDEEEGKWNDFQLILVDGVVLGATSPRTLVFTGVAHKCPPSIPFRSANGRLSDPVAYYKRFGDAFYLQLLASWLEGLTASLEQKWELSEWMGNIPATVGATTQSRMALLMDRLNAWHEDLMGLQSPAILGDHASRFTLSPYTILKGLPRLEGANESDLFLRGRDDVIVCYRSETGSKVVNDYNEPLVNEKLHIYDGRWALTNQPLPLPADFLPDSIEVIEDPLDLFEDSLIKVNLPKKIEDVYYLKVGDDQYNNLYLFPFKQKILEYFSPSEIARNTKIVSNSQSRALQVELRIPLENGRFILATQKYPVDTPRIIVDAETAELAAWPDFTCPSWNHYFYFKGATSDRQVDFQPAVAFQERSTGIHTWYHTTEPSPAFVGSIDGKKGLLLLCDKSISSPDKFWKVGIDFGSTHTRAFSLLVDRQEGGFETTHGALIQPIIFSTYARSLTACDPNVLRSSFFALKNSVEPSERNELKTLLMMPETTPGNAQDWLPREGYVYLHWIYGGDYDADRLRHSLKWNSNRADADLRAFLRCLMMMVQAEAVKQRAEVVSVTHTYPSVFTEALVAKHNAEWKGLQQYMNAGVEEGRMLTVQDATMTETVAVCRHLEWEQGASPVSNTISIDVGGSTSDMAVWAKKKLAFQESIKMAAGIVGRYLQSPDAKEFLVWLESTLHGAPYNLKSFSLSKFDKKPSGYSLMFNNVLSLVELQGHLKVLVKQINGAKESRKVLSHIIYLYAALLYYAGLLARKAGMRGGHESYHIYFCGKGGTLVEWVRGFDVLSQEMFTAGLLGPSESDNKSSPKVIAKISSKPKEEVGRGLLAESELEGNPKDGGLGLIDPNPPSVTVGESGYEGLTWDGTLTSGALKNLPDSVVPKMSELTELCNFLKAFKEGGATSSAAIELNLDRFDSNAFRNHLLQRLFGAAKGCIISDIRKNDTDALLEPLLITEVKALLETSTCNHDLFN